MSVVNKMLQDLEARQSQVDEIDADYHPPQKKQSKLLVLVLLILAIAAILFALTDKNYLFSTTTKTSGNAPITQPTPLPVIQKMTVALEKKPEVSALPLHAKNELVETESDLIPASSIPTNPAQLPQELAKNTNEQSSSQKIESQIEQQEPEIYTKLNTQETPELKSSFSMTGSSSENNTSNLKQRIAESLTSDNLDLAQSLLNELLLSEPDNIKARKKLASLLFAQGHYAQTKQLLLQGIELHPTQSDLRMMLARLFVMQKEPSEALQILVENEPGIDNQTEYLAYRAALAQQLKQTNLAKSDYQTLTNIESNNAKWWLGLAIAEDQLGDIKMAVQAYNKASSLDQLHGSVSDFIQQRISVLAGAQ